LVEYALIICLSNTISPHQKDTIKEIIPKVIPGIPVSIIKIIVMQKQQIEAKNKNNFVIILLIIK